MRHLTSFLILGFACLTVMCSDDAVNDLGPGLDPVPNDAVVFGTCIVDRSCSQDQYHLFRDGDSDEDHKNAMIDYFHDLGLEIYDAGFVRYFYEAVCEACYICPSGSVYPVEMNREDVPELLARSLWLTDCNKETAYIKMTYEGTKCSDLWTQGHVTPNESDYDHKRALAEHLLEKDIIPSYIDIYREGGQACEACSCKSGIVYSILVELKDHEVLNEMGFKPV